MNLLCKCKKNIIEGESIMLKMFQEVCENANHLDTNNLVINLKSKLYLLQEMTIKIAQKNGTKEEKEEWFEIVSFLMEGIEQKDKVLLIDCIKYAIIPYLTKLEQEIN